MYIAKDDILKFEAMKKSDNMDRKNTEEFQNRLVKIIWGGANVWTLDVIPEKDIERKALLHEVREKGKVVLHEIILHVGLLKALSNNVSTLKKIWAAWPYMLHICII